MSDFETTVQFVHSHGPDNKDPLYDLGGQPSSFAIAVSPMNNLFDNITPEEDSAGMTDYRCFYVVNKTPNAIMNISMTMTPASCTSTTFGTKEQDDEQLVTLTGTPQASGYAILKTEFGPAFTVYYNGSFAAFGNDFQTKILTVPFCENCTVSTNVVSSTEAQYTVTFTGCAGKRKVQPIAVVQNDLVSQQGNEYRIDGNTSRLVANVAGTSKIQVTQQIASGTPLSGILHTVNTTDKIGEYWHFPYSSFSGVQFSLVTALPADLISDSATGQQQGGGEVWVDGSQSMTFSSTSGTTLTVSSSISGVPNAGDLILYNATTNTYVSVAYTSYSGSTFNLTSSLSFTPASTMYVVIPYPQPSCNINVTKIQDGWPINQYAWIIDSETIVPDYSDQGTMPLSFGFLRPAESFFIWTKRQCLPSTTPCTDQMSYSVTAQAVPWPPSRT